MTKWTSEPWKAHKEDRSPWVILGLSADKYGGHPFIAEMQGGRHVQADAARIVACVNSCAGMENPKQDVTGLVTALVNLSNEAAGWGEKGLTEMGGLTNARCFQERIDQARAAIAKAKPSKA